MKIYGYYPGCSLEGTAKDFEIATKAIFKLAGVELKELEDWSCCGASSCHFVSHLLSIAVPARNLVIAKKSGFNELVVSCAACFSRLKTATHELEEDDKLKAQVDEALEEKYEGGVKVRHIIEVLLEDIGIEKLKTLVTKPLKGLKVASYYGCLLVRPPKVMKFDDPDNPQSIDKLVALAGATAVDWPHKTECCGASLTLSESSLTLDPVKRILEEAHASGADMIVVACPLCQANLDMRQMDLKRKKLIDFEIPVIYFSQLLGLSFGLKPSDVALEKVLVSPNKALKKVEPVQALDAGARS